MRNLRTRHDVVTIPGITVNVVIRCAAGVGHRTSQDGSEAYLLSWSKATGGSFTKGKSGRQVKLTSEVNPLNAELNPICYLLALLAHHFLHVSTIRVKSLTLRLLMSYIYMERIFLMFLDHTQRRTTVGRTPLDE